MNERSHTKGTATRRIPAAGTTTGATGSQQSAIQARIDTSPRSVTQRRMINDCFRMALQPHASEGVVGQRRIAPSVSAKAPSSPVAQRYTEEEDGHLKVSTNRKFALRNEGQGGQLYVIDDVDLPDLQHVELQRAAQANINGTQMREVVAAFENQPAMEEMFCGKFSESVTGVIETTENEHAQVGRSLYTDGVTHQGIGWQNHYAPVILVDGDDRGTLETAVGLTYCWFGIYGSARGQTFRYKTQVANIARSMRNDWMNQATGGGILEVLHKYKDDEPQEGAIPEYAQLELNKLEALAEKRDENPGDLAPKEVHQTPAPKTKQEGDQINLQNMIRQERLARNKLFLQILSGIGIPLLALLAYYCWRT